MNLDLSIKSVIRFKILNIILNSKHKYKVKSKHKSKHQEEVVIVSSTAPGRQKTLSPEAGRPKEVINDGLTVGREVVGPVEMLVAEASSFFGKLLGTSL